MSAAIQLVSSQVSHLETVVGDVENLSSGSTEQKLRRALESIQRLQAEVQSMHSALAQAERALAQKDTLLRNAILREQELRAELVKGAF